MGMFRSISGSMRVRIVSADPETVLSRLNADNIILSSLSCPESLTMEASIRVADYKKVCAIAEATGAGFTVIGKEGYYWTIKDLFKRPVLILGLLSIFLLILYIPGRIFFVQVEGNQSVPDNYILEQAELCGIGFGVNRRTVRSESVKNALLQRIPQLQWIGVNTSGCVATVSVKEKTESSQTDAEVGDSKAISSIVAACDGIIQEIYVKKGNPLCKTGQAVQAGQILVSGYTDCGLSICASRADAEIYALTNRKLCMITPLDYAVRGPIQRSYRRIYLQIGKKLINLYNNSGISDATCVKICKKDVLTLPGGFALPVAVVTELYYDYETGCCNSNDEEQTDWVSDYAEQYLKEHMIAGQILQKVTDRQSADNCHIFMLDYICREMIGLEKQEEIIQ